MSRDIACGFRSFNSVTVLSDQINPAKSLALLVLLLSFSSCYRVSIAANIHPIASTIEGIVRDGQNPISGAFVRVQATEISTFTDDQGHFILTELSFGESVPLTAWAPGYYIVGGDIISYWEQGR